jgi:hypothetical protein
MTSSTTEPPTVQLPTELAKIMLATLRQISGLHVTAAVEDHCKAAATLPVIRAELELKLKQREDRIFEICHEQDDADKAIRRVIGAGIGEPTIDAVTRCAENANKASGILTRVRNILGARSDEDTVPALERVLEETRAQALATGAKLQEIR